MLRPVFLEKCKQIGKYHMERISSDKNTESVVKTNKLMGSNLLEKMLVNLPV